MPIRYVARTALKLCGVVKVNIDAPVVAGSGVLVLHRQLQAKLDNYRVRALSPMMGLYPRLCQVVAREPAELAHSLPELGPWVVHPDAQLVATFHNYYLDDVYCRQVGILRRHYYQRVLASAVEAALRRATVLTAVSRATADLVLTHHDVATKLLVIRNGVDTRRFRPLDQERLDGPVRVLFSGNPSPRKGLSDLLHLVDALPENVVLQYTSGTRSSAVSTIPQSARVKALARRPHSEMPALYHEADVFFLPSRREGLSLALLEAVASGLPVLTTNASSMPEVIDHGKGGFLFEPGDAINMYRYLKKLVSDPHLRAEMGAYNRAKCLSEFSEERMLGEYRQLFGSIFV